MVTNILILSLLDKDKKGKLGSGENRASGGLRSTPKEPEQIEQEEQWESHPCSLPSDCLVWMPPPAYRTELPPIITQCTWARQHPAYTAAATRGPHLFVRDAPRKERAAPGLGRPLCSLWAGVERGPQGKGC